MFTITRTAMRVARASPWRSARYLASTAITPVHPDILPGESMPRPEHAVISTFDLFSIGIGPSSSHTVGPMRAGKIFVEDLRGLGLLHRVESLKITLYGSLAATGKGHMTPEAVIMGLESSDPETIETSTVSSRYDNIVSVKHMMLGGEEGKRIRFDMVKDMGWRLDPLPEHPNGMRFSVFDANGDMLATNQYFSVGGGFVVNNETQTTENVYYRNIIKADAEPSRRDQMHGQQLQPAIAPPPSDPTAEEVKVAAKPPFLFRDAATLIALTEEHNLTIAQIVWENELAFKTAPEIREGLLKLWQVMDECIRSGVTSTEPTLPGGLNVKRRAPGLYRRLQRGFYPSNLVDAGTTPGLTPKSKLAEMNRLAIGKKEHDLKPVPLRVAPVFPGIEYLSAMAIAVNEVNASGGRVVTAPTNGAAGVIPATLKYVTEFLSEDMERDVMTFLLTASAIGMLFKRGATISAADGGCMSEVGVACSMAAGGLAACLGASPSVITQAAEIGIEHNLGLTCDPIHGLVQIPCIERNSLGAVKAVTAAQLAMAGDGEHTVSLDDAIEAVRTTARDMHSHYKETSLAGLATTVKIPLSSPAC